MTSAAERGTATIRRLACLAVAALALAACDPGGPAVPAGERERAAAGEIAFSGPTMGTTWSVKLVPREPDPALAARQAIDRAIRDRLVQLEGLMSTWDPDSELSRFNRWRRTDPFPVSIDTFAVFRWAVDLAEQTSGALDVTVLPLVRAWGFGGPPGEAPPPDEATIGRLAAATGARHLELDPEGRWIRKRRPDVECDVSALEPGYVADRLADLLAERGLANFLIDVGGELVARGRNGRGVPWQVGLERAEATRQRVGRIVTLDNLAVATSGDYRNYREVNGKRITHIIDPRTARPIDHALAAVTVVDALGVRADALATALMVLGPEDGMRFARARDLAALFVVRTAGGGFEERATSRFDALDGQR
jgi:thiamine biosynthesis lipoprotein